MIQRERICNKSDFCGVNSLFTLFFRVNGHIGETNRAYFVPRNIHLLRDDFGWNPKGSLQMLGIRNFNGIDLSKHIIEFCAQLFGVVQKQGYRRCFFSVFFVCLYKIRLRFA